MTFVLRALPWSRVVAPPEVELREAITLALERIEADVELEDEVLEASIDRALLERFGAWAGGWCWGKTDGGPIQSYCCPSHSLSRANVGLRRAAAQRVAAALIEWRDLVNDLASHFDQLAASSASSSIEEAVERAAARLLPLVVTRTDTSDAWYRTFIQVLVWYLEATGHDGDAAQRVVTDVVRGPFESWLEPAGSIANEVCATLGKAMARAAEPMPIDALAQWKQTRARAFRQPPLRYRVQDARADGHRAFIDRVDHARSEVRADRMRAALEACRASAHAGEPLTLERLASWQALVLGHEAPLRERNAFAKRGRERYGFDGETMPDLVRALADAQSRESPITRAARVYLDVAFFHPFEDGNARAARLAMDHVLTREGLALHAAEPVFVVSRAASDVEGASAFVWLVDYLVGPFDPPGARR